MTAPFTITKQEVVPCAPYRGGNFHDVEGYDQRLSIFPEHIARRIAAFINEHPRSSPAA